LLVRAQEMARYVESGALDAGITGHDWVVETARMSRGVGVWSTPSSGSPRVRWSWLCRKTRRSGKRATWKEIVVATEVVHITESYLASMA